MDKHTQIAHLLREITGTERHRQHLWLMEVVSVEGDTCTARLGELEIPDVRLSVVKGGATAGVLITPAPGSMVLVADLSAGELRRLAVVGFTDVENIALRIGDYIVESLTDTLHNIIDTFNAHTHTLASGAVEVTGPAGTQANAVPITVPAVMQGMNTIKQQSQ